MNKSIKILLAALFAVSATVCAEVRDINKTFVALRDQRNRAANLTTFSTIATPKNDDRLCGAFEVTGFYNGGSKSAGIGGAFLLNGRNSFEIIDAVTDEASQIDGENIVHINASGASVTASKVALNPEVNSYGVLLKYNQQLDGLAEGLWFAVNAPIANVQTNVNSVITTQGASAQAIANGFSNPGEYFSGKTGTIQDGLKYGKVDGKAHDRTELGDVEVQLGWNFVDSEKHQVGINVGVLFPTGTKPTAEFLFEPVVGGVHWGLGAGFNANTTMWDNEDAALRFISTVDYRYLLEDTERRILGLSITGESPALSHYVVAQAFGAAQNALLFPAANVLARDFNITPGSQVDAIAMFEYTNGGFSLDLGYNLFFKDAETGSLKQAWTDNTYGVVPVAFDTAAVAGALAHGAVGAVAQRLASINNTEEAAGTNISAGFRIDKDAALTPSALTHKVFAGAGYTATEWDYPVMVGVGGSFEFVNNARTAAEGFGVWGKLGVAF